MGKFSVEKKGYKISEVDDYILNKELETDRNLKEKQDRIDELRQENFKLSKQLEEYKLKEKNISQALIDANARAKEIEKVSKQKYSYELKNLDDFYAKWEKFFNELVVKYPKMQNFDTNKVLENLKSDINNLLKNEFHIEKINNKKSNSFESLLDKLKSHRTKTTEKVVLKINKTPNKEIIYESENEIEYMNESNKVNNIKPITNLTLSESEHDEYDSLLDKFLHSSNNVSKGYEDSILNKGKKAKKENYPTPNESGFDLEEALNPTEDLLKIMKGFKLD